MTAQQELDLADLLMQVDDTVDHYVEKAKLILDSDWFRLQLGTARLLARLQESEDVSELLLALDRVRTVLRVEGADGMGIASIVLVEAALDGTEDYDTWLLNLAAEGRHTLD